MKRRSAVLILLAAAAAGCRSAAPRPACSVENELGAVRAESLRCARRWASELEAAARALEPFLPGLRARPVDLWVVPSLPQPEVHGQTYDDRIEVRASTPPEARRFLLAHELVHWRADDTWQRLPYVLQEGLGDWAAMRVDPIQGTRRRAEHALFIATLSGGGMALAELGAELPDPRERRWRLRAQVDPDRTPALASLLERSDEELASLQAEPGGAAIYAAGWLYVERIGPERLRALCRRAVREDRASVPPLWIHRAAGFDRYDPAQWAVAAREAIGPAERAYLLLQARSAIDQAARETAAR